MNLENWDNITSIIANSIAIVAAIWAFLQFVGWMQKRHDDSSSVAKLELQAAQHTERLEKLRQEIARAEQTMPIKS